ncbi:MAG: SH3 domain-containing protein [Clostridium sp.]|nr:SH3 domain-containing protein [Clostridium sp.]MCM1444715.1 SH3 domain-containing protein [Candidatus Amulumruptor caecigallinarius]
MLKKIVKYIAIILVFTFSLNINVNAESVSYTKGVVVDKNGKVLRKSSNTSSDNLATLPFGTVFSILEGSGTGNGCGSNVWYKITYQSNTGYICSSSINLIDESYNGKKGYVAGEKYLRNAPNTTTSQILETMPSGSEFNVLGLTTDNKYYYITYKDKQGFIYNYSDVKIIPDVETTDDDFKKNVLVNFPESYHPYLINLHNLHPTWSFEAYNTGVTFKNAVEKESPVGVSLINTTYQGYYSTDGGSYDYKTDTFYIKEGSSWYAANASTIAYYMDPRNYLSERYIFAFEKLSYDENIHTVEAVTKTLSNYSNLLVYAADFVNAGKDTKVSPIHLATRSAQEIGPSTTAISGTSKFICGEKSYDGGYYNFYNIGAFTSDNPVVLALCTAVNKGWDTPYKAIVGGANTISNGYVKTGQDTGYLQKYNIKNGSINTSHQYMTNVAAPMSEASITYNGYKSSGILEGNFIFKIPVYEQLPDAISVLPPEGNPNNYLKTVTIDGKVLDTFDLDKTNYNISIPSGTKSINLSGLPVSSKSSVSGTGTIDLTKTTSVSITVKAQNKTTRTYTFNFTFVEPQYESIKDIINNIGVKNDDNYIFEVNNQDTVSITEQIKSKNASVNVEFKTSSGVAKTTTSLSTGDMLSLSIENESKTYIVVVYGDTDGNGNIDILDLLRIQKVILGSLNLKDEYSISCDVNNDSKVDILDLLKVQKYILGVSKF